MRFYEIKEAAYTPIAKEQSEDIIKKYHDQLVEYIDNGVDIWRGMKGNKDLFLGDGDQLKRKAANTTNYANSLFDVLPIWKDWPKRSKSFIGTTSNSQAYAYSHNIYHMIPLEHQKIGVCLHRDFWDTMRITIVDFNDNLDNLKHWEKINLPEDNPKKLILELKNFKTSIENDPILKEIYTKHSSRRYNRTISSMLEFPTVEEFLNKFLDPNYGNVLVNNTKEIKDTNAKGEVWMTGKVLFITDWQLDKFKRSISNATN